ncbi:MAG: hypothetical protein U0361_20795 [Nitrospiraceae bacterium]
MKRLYDASDTIAPAGVPPALLGDFQAEGRRRSADHQGYGREDGADVRFPAKSTTHDKLLDASVWLAHTEFECWRRGHANPPSVSMLGVQDGDGERHILVGVAPALCCVAERAESQSVSVRGFGGGVAPLFNLVGPGNLYVDNQGTQGFIYNFGNNFESYNFRNPTTGQARAVP